MVALKMEFVVLLLIYCLLSVVASYDGYDEALDPYNGGHDSGYGGYEGFGGTAANELRSMDEITTFLSEEDQTPAVVAYFDTTKSHYQESREVFDEFALDMEGMVRMAYTTTKEILEEMKFRDNALVIYKPSAFVDEKMEKSKVRYPNPKLKIDSLRKYVTEKALPLVGERTFNKKQDLYVPRSNQAPVLTVFMNLDLKKDKAGFNYVANRLRKLDGTKLSRNGTVVFSVANKEKFSSLISEEFLGGETLPPGKYGIFLGIEFKNKFYGWPNAGPFSVDEVKKFIDAFSSGELIGHEKKAVSAGSEEEDDVSALDESDVVFVNSNNILATLENRETNVMVEFYAPWCGHCKALKPEYAKLATAFAKDSGVVVAAVDATDSSLAIPEKFDVQGYPTLFFLPKDEAPIPYDGPRSMKGMKDFIEKHRK